MTIKKTKTEPQSSGEIRLFNTTPMEFLDWVKFTYILPKPEIKIDKEVKTAKVKLQNEKFSLSIDANPILNGVQLIYKYWDWNCDNWEALHKFEYGINELSKKLTYKKIIITKEIAKLPKLENPKIKEPWEFSRPNKQERDRIIWTMRENKNTWDEIYSKLDEQDLHAAMSTIEINYKRMKELTEKIG